MTTSLLRSSIKVLLICFAFVGIAVAQPYAPEKIRADFVALLQRPAVDAKPFFQTTTTDSLIIEKGYFYSEATEKVPVLIYKPVTKKAQPLPVIICLHGTGGSKEDMKELLKRFSQLGFMAVAIDGRYHGERVIKTDGHNAYVEAIIKAWGNKDAAHQQHPFLFDTVHA